MEKFGAVAQLAERNVRNVEAGSSTLLRSIFGFKPVWERFFLHTAFCRWNTGNERFRWRGGKFCSCAGFLYLQDAESVRMRNFSDSLNRMEGSQ